MRNNIVWLLPCAAFIAVLLGWQRPLVAQVNVEGSSVPREWRSLPLDLHGRDTPNDGSAIPPSWRSKIPDASLGRNAGTRSGARGVRAIPGDILADARNVEKARTGDLKTLSDIGPALAACRLASGRTADIFTQVELILRFSLRRNGTLIGEPRVIFLSPQAFHHEKQQASDVALAILKSCLPLPLSPSLGGAIAGRPISARF